MRSEDGLIFQTPELVPIRLRPAGWGRRLQAFLLDLLLIVLIAGSIASLCIQWLPSGIGTATAIVMQFLIIWGYHVYFDSQRHGRSPGKRLVGLRTVDIHGLPIALPQALVRNLVRLIDLLPALGGCAAVCMLIDTHRRRLGDLAAGTVVIDERQVDRVRVASRIERRHNSLDTHRIRHAIRHRLDQEHRLLLATLCLRADRLADQARYACMAAAARYFRRQLDLPETNAMSDENLIRNLAALAVGH